MYLPLPRLTAERSVRKYFIFCGALAASSLPRVVIGETDTEAPPLHEMLCYPGFNARDRPSDGPFLLYDDETELRVHLH